MHTGWPIRVAGILVAIALTSCSQNSTKKQGHKHDHKTHADAQDETHQHQHHAPHGGALIPLGDHFAHLEVVLAPKTGDLTVFVLDKEAEKAVRIAQKEIALQISMGKGDNAREIGARLGARANDLTGDTVGDSSEFTVNVEELKNVDHFRGRVLEINLLGQEIKDLEFTYPSDEGHAHDH